jgi:hypothetical protein
MFVTAYYMILFGSDSQHFRVFYGFYVEIKPTRSLFVLQ